MHTLGLILNLFVFRARPQDLPVSIVLLAMVAAVAVVADFLVLPDREPLLGHVLFVSTRPLLYGGVVWFLLKQRNHEARWVQTATALFAALAALSVTRLPLLPALIEMVKQGQEQGQMVLGWQAYASFVLEIWFLALVARILREALEIKPWLSAIVCVGVVFSIEITRLMLAPSFGLTDMI